MARPRFEKGQKLDRETPAITKHNNGAAAGCGMRPLHDSRGDVLALLSSRLP